MLSLKWLLAIILLICVQQICPDQIKLEGDHVCNRTSNMTESEIDRRTNLCFTLFIGNFTKCLKDLNDENTESFCCDGYYQSGSKCLPKCTCEHGVCSTGVNDTKVCSCHLNFSGPNCTDHCPPFKFGEFGCEKSCDCILNPKCNTHYAHCSCFSNNISKECEDICKCRKEVNRCDPGWLGKNCSLACEDYSSGTYGPLCSHKCKCVKENTVECNKENGDCVCKDGYFGEQCEHVCSEGILECKSHLNKVHCTCELTIAQRMKLIEKSKDCLVITLSLLSLLFIALLGVVYKYKIRSTKLKERLNKISMRYVNDNKDDFDNQIYSTNLVQTDSNQTSNSSLRKEAKPFKFYEFMNRINTLPNYLPKLPKLSKLNLKSSVETSVGEEAKERADSRASDTSQTYSNIENSPTDSQMTIKMPENF